MYVSDAKLACLLQGPDEVTRWHFDEVLHQMTRRMGLNTRIALEHQRHRLYRKYCSVIYRSDYIFYIVNII